MPLRCKRWGCPTCGPINRRRLVRRLKTTEVTHLITLTCRPSSFPSPQLAFKHLSAAVPNLVKRIQRQFPAVSFQYLLVWETTRAGWPHAHILARTSYLPQRALSRHWRELTGAPVVDIRRVTDYRAATSYLAKYLTKNLAASPHLKRYRTSRHFWPTPGGMFGPRQPQQFPWQVIREGMRYALLAFPHLLYLHQPLPGDAWFCIPRPPPTSPPPPTCQLPAGAEIPSPLPSALLPHLPTSGGGVQLGAWGGVGARGGHFGPKITGQ